MKRIVNIITLLDLLFLFLFSLSSIIGAGISSDILYYSAFIAPSLIAVLYIREARPITENPRTVSLSATENTRKIAPLIIPLTALVSLFAMATSAIMASLGVASEASLGDSVILALLIHALLPAIFEEFLFRYVPLKLLLPYSERWAVIISAVYFALLHLDIAKLPYALFAGFIFSLIDIAAGSVLPSVIMHLLNNALSVLLLFYPEGSGFIAIVAVAIGLLLVSFIFALPRLSLFGKITEPLFKKEERQEIPAAPILLIFATLFIAISNLFL